VHCYTQDFNRKQNNLVFAELKIILEVACITIPTHNMTFMLFNHFSSHRIKCTKAKKV